MSEHTDKHFEDVIDLKQILGTIVNNKWTVIITTLVFMVLGIIYCWHRAPLYQSDLMINVSSKSSNALESSLLQNIPGLAGGFSREDPVSTELNILTSRSVLLPVIKKLNLDIVVIPHQFPFIGSVMSRHYNASNYDHKVASPWLGMNRYAWGGSKVSVSKLEVPPQLLGSHFKITYKGKNTYTLSEGGKVLGQGQVGKDETFQAPPYAQPVTINVNRLITNPGTQFFVEKLRDNDALNSLSASLSASQTDKMASLIQVSLKGVQPKKIQQILNAIADSAQQQSINEKSAQAGKMLVFLKERIPSVEKKLIAAEKALNNYKSTTGNISVDGQAKAMLQMLGQLESQITNLLVQRASLEQQFTANSPQVQQVNTQLDSLHEQRAKLEARIKALPQADQQLMQLTRDVTIQNAVYTNLLSNLQQFELLKEGTIGDVQILDSAYLPYKPINKPAPLIIALMAILGIFLSVAYIFIRQYLFRGIEDPDVIENKFNVPVLGSFHESKLQFKQLSDLAKHKISHLKLLEEIDSHDLTVESFRSLRTNLLFELAKADNNIISISGPVPNVGKSFVSANLAASLAETGKKVLLIDADIRKGDLYQYFTQKRYPGFCDFLTGKATLEDSLRETRIPNLTFMPTGHLPKRHTQILMSNEFNQLLETLQPQYDVILIDTAPVLAVTDGLIVGKHASIKLMILAYGKHNDHELKYTFQKYEKAGLNISGCIFNFVRASGSSFAYRYQYQYRYGNGKTTQDRNGDA